MVKETIPKNDSPLTPLNALQQEQQRSQTSSSNAGNNSTFVSVINNGYTAASREFERFFSLWGFNKRTNSTQATKIESTQTKYHGKRKRGSIENNTNSSTDEENGTAVYGRIIPDVYHSPLNNNTNNTNNSLTTYNPAPTFEPPTPDSSKNTKQHRHTFRFLVEREHVSPTRSQGKLSSMEAHQQHTGENEAPANTSTHLQLNDNDSSMDTTRRLKSESASYTSAPNRTRNIEPLYVPSAVDTAKYVDLDILEKERLAKLERIVQEARSNATQLLSISQNSKSTRAVRFSPIVKHASIISPHTSRSSSNPSPLVSSSPSLSPSSSYLSPQYSTPPPSSAYTRARLSLSLENPSPSPRRGMTSTTPLSRRIKNQSAGSPTFSLLRSTHDPLTTTPTISNGTWGITPIPKHEQDDGNDKDNDIYDTYDGTDNILLKANLPSSKPTSFEPFSTSPTELKTTSSSLPPPSTSLHIQQRSSSVTHSPLDSRFAQQQQQQQQQKSGNIVNGHKVLPTESSPRKKLKTVDFDEAHKKTMGIIIHQIPKVVLRRTDTIRGPDGQWKPNPIWNEIYNNGKNKSRPL